MSYVQREYEKLMTLCQTTPPGAAFDAAYAAKQALAWALDPDTVASPSAQIGKHYQLDIEGTKGTGIALDSGSGFGGDKHPAAPPPVQ